MAHGLQVGGLRIAEGDAEQKASALTIWKPVSGMMRGNEEPRTDPR